MKEPESRVILHFPFCVLVGELEGKTGRLGMVMIFNMHGFSSVDEV